jgi:hypothetical protein
MATTTPNFGWAVPTSTDLVKDGAVAIETLGDAIDASLLDLKGGTTDQLLAKNSNTDMDFKWITAAGGGGKVLQVIMGSTSTTVNNSTSTYTDTGLSATITPAAATSKVLVLVSQNIYKDPNETPSMRLVRGATTLQRYDANVFVSGTPEMAAYMPIAYLDSPSTTSATTYKTTFCSLANSAYVAVQQDYGYSQNGFSSIILMEIGA